MDPAPQVPSDMNVPIALRRGKRRSSVLYSPQKPRGEATNQIQSTTTTPTRRRKRVRFSDSAVPSNTNSMSTGITPYLRRASLGTPRRQVTDTPSRARLPSDVVQFTPFKQVLDDRTKRRIRRNGLSNEMNEYEEEKKTKTALQKEIDDKDAELKRLRAELEEARNKPVLPNRDLGWTSASQERCNEVEAELEALRQSFALEDSLHVPTWDHVPIGMEGPSSEGGDTICIYEDSNTESNLRLDADSLAMGLELEAARHAKESFLGSFRDIGSSTDIHFADSPARRSSKAAASSPDPPRTPRTFLHDLSKQLKATTNRAEEVELALKALESEIVGLGFGEVSASGSEAVAAIVNHFRQARLELERALPGESAIGFENAKILPELVKKLNLLAEQLQHKEVELKGARDQQHNLKGNFEKAIIAAEKANAHIKDLEKSIDDSAEDMLNVRMRAQSLEKDLAEKEKDVASLTTALNKYRSDVSRLEHLISQLEADHAATLLTQNQTVSDLDAQVASEQRGRRAAESSSIARLSKITELESALEQAREHATTVETAMTKLQSQLTTSNTSRNEEVGSLNTRISNLSTALASANAEVEKLKITKCKLEERVRMEVEQGAQAVEAIQAALIRSVAKTNENKKHYIRSAKVRVANWELSDDLESDGVAPLTPASMVKFAEFSEEISHGSGEDNDADDHVPGSVEISRGRQRTSDRGLCIRKSRRRYDSGIGMSPVSELDDVAEAGQGFQTPEFGSDADFDMNDDGDSENVNVEMMA